MGVENRFDAFRALADRRGRPGVRLLESLASASAEALGGPPDWAPEVAARFGLPASAGLGPATYYADLAAQHAPRHIRICTAAACFAAKGRSPLVELDGVFDGIGVDGAPVDVPAVDAATTDAAAMDVAAMDAAAMDAALAQLRGEPGGWRAAHAGVSVQAVRCLGFCYASPACLDGETPCTGPGLVDQLLGRAAPSAPAIPVADATGDPVVLAGVVGGEASWRVWPDAVRNRTPASIRAEIAASGLRGRGGAGFPVAAKWAATEEAPGAVVIANGDEGDPGSFADRLLMEVDPDRVLEGLALACLAVGARLGVVLVRSEYPQALARMREAVARAQEDGHLGCRIHGSGVDLEVRVAAGAGSYVAGEETALIAGLEGGRGTARARPPYPVRSGLWGAPTVVNNVETLAAVPWIMSRGGAAYARRGDPDEPGTKLVCLSERFRRPGCYEVELGAPVQWIVAELGGGMKEGAELAALQVGGPLGGFLAPDRLDVPLTEAALSGRGAALGHAGLVAFDQRPSPEDVLRHVWEFAAAESCGACSPCRVGSRRGLEMVEDGTSAGYASLLRVMDQASLCAFGRRVPPAVRSLARAYGDRLAEWDR